MRNPLTVWRRFLARSNDDRLKIFGVVFLTALVSSVVVSATFVALKPLQQAQLIADKNARMASMLDQLPGMRDIMQQQGIDALETRLVELNTGRFAKGTNADDFDLQAATDDPDRSVEIPPEADVAHLKRRSKLALVHLLERDGEVLLLVLPMSGSGYQSTLRAMLALEADLTTIAALTITEQGETPGIGARIEDRRWQDLWPGKQIADKNGQIVIDVVRGKAVGPYQVDGITGATVTGNGIANMLRYWLGDHGFGPLLNRLHAEGL